MNESAKPVISQRGGLWLSGRLIAGGYLYWGGYMSWPFAWIDVYPGRFVIVHARYFRDEIVSLRQRWGPFCTGLEITHRKYSKPQTIVFWSLGFRALKRALEECGFEVAE